MPIQSGQFHSPPTSTKPIEGGVLDACAKVSRVSPIHAEYVGLLMSEPEVGARLVLALDDRRRLRTSSIRKIEGGPNNSLFIDTANSRYWIRRLSQGGAPVTNPLDTSRDERRELLLFDALRLGLGFVHGLEREQIRYSLRDAGMIPHQATDGCESWHWPGYAPTGPCQHGFKYEK